MVKNNIKLQVIGNHDLLPKLVLKGLNKVIEQTKNNTNKGIIPYININLLLSFCNVFTKTTAISLCGTAPTRVYTFLYLYLRLFTLTLCL